MKSLRASERIGADLFTHHHKEYLGTVCYKSNFWELDRLIDTKSSTVMKELKSHLARYDISKQLVTDNGPQFTSSEFTRLEIFASIRANFFRDRAKPGS